MNASQPSHQAHAYRSESADPAHARDEVLAVWHDNLGDPVRHVGKFDWFYLHNPYGEPLLQLLHHGDAVIGCCGAAPRRMLWNGREIRGGQLADMAVETRHRTLGPALLLQEALVAEAQSRFDLLYGFPNARSLPVVKRLGYAVLGEMVRHARVLKHAGYLERYLPDWLAVLVGGLFDAAMALRDLIRGAAALAVSWVDAADPRMDALWQRSRPAQGLVAIRDAAMLRWRFDACPLGKTQYLLVHGRDGALCAWFACQVAGSVLRIADFWNEQGNAGIDHRVVLALVRAARRGGYSSVSLALAAPAASLAGWRRAGFVPREGQPVVGKWLGAGPAPEELTAHWFLSNLDEDE